MKYKTKAIEAQRRAIARKAALKQSVHLSIGEVRNIPVEGAQYPACGQVIPGSSWMPTMRRGEVQAEPRNLEQSFIGTNGTPSNYAKESGAVSERWLPELTAEESKGLSAVEKVEARELKRLEKMPGTWKRKYLPHGQRRELVNIVRGVPGKYSVGGQRWATFLNGVEVKS